MSENSSEAKRPVFKGRILPIIGYIVWLSGGFIGSQYLAVELLRLIAWLGVPLREMNPSVLQTIAAAVSYVLAFVIIVGVPTVVIRQKTSKDQLGLKRLMSFSDIGLALVGIIPYLLLSFVFVLVARMLIPDFDVAQTQDVGYSNVSKQFEYLTAFFALVVAAPVAEEMLFRGYLYGKLKTIANTTVSVILVSLVFAVLHMQLNVGIDVFALSIVLCVLRELTGSIWAGILLHMMKNGLAFYLLFINPMLIQ